MIFLLLSNEECSNYTESCGHFMQFFACLNFCPQNWDQQLTTTGHCVL